MRLLLDGAERPIAQPSASGRVALTSALPAEAPISAWRELVATSRDGRRTLDIARFAEKYREFEVILYRDPQQGPALGLFRKPSPSLPAHLRAKLAEPHLALTDVATIAIRTKERPEDRADGAAALSLALGGAPRNVSAAELERLDKVLPPGLAARDRGGAGKKAGWPLAKVLAMVGSKADVGPLVARNDTGETLAIPAADKNGPVVLLRLNQRGMFELSLWPSGATEPSARLRGVSVIERAATAGAPSR